MWKIYYDNGFTFSSEDGNWEDAPQDGVVFVIQKIGDKIVTQSGGDNYVLLDNETIICTDDLGPILRKFGIFKFGRWTSNKKFTEISKRVTEDAKEWQR